MLLEDERELVNRLEAGIAHLDHPEVGLYLASIAISLKRIADSLEVSNKVANTPLSD